MGVSNSGVTKKTDTVESTKLYFLSISPYSLSLSLFHSYNSEEETTIKCTIMQVNVYALKQENDIICNIKV